MIIPLSLRLKLGSIGIFKSSILAYQKAETDFKRNTQYLSKHTLTEVYNSNITISIVMAVYKPPINFLIKAIDSVIVQRYENWELCIVDDNSQSEEVSRVLNHYADKEHRIKVKYRQSNGNISQATNDAIEVATGNFIGFMDHDDELHPSALSEMVFAALASPLAKIFYSDEDKVDQEGNYYDAHFKSDWNRTLFYGYNYLNHFTMVERTLINAVDGLRVGFEGSQDYDLILRCIERLTDSQIVHIPKILYHWRAIPGSTALCADEKSYAWDAGVAALQEHFERLGKPVFVSYGPFPTTYKIDIKATDIEQPEVAIIIPTRDRYELLADCVSSLLDKTLYQNYKIYIVDNDSEEASTLAYFNKLKENKRITIIRQSGEFNFSALNNAIALSVNQPLILFLNNDTKISNPEWLEEMVKASQFDDVGVVGAKLYFADDTIQHAGVILGIGGVAGHGHKYRNKGDAGYFSRLCLPQELSAVTAAAMLVKADAFKAVGGFDEVNLKVAFNDVDLCLRISELGYKILWTPYAELYHLESKSRGEEISFQQKSRFQGEVEYMLKRWEEKLSNDPFYNPNLTLESEDFIER